jgi:hypothetical protein
MTGGCAAFRFDVDAALREGWDQVEGRLYCDLHAPVEARKALAARELEILRARTAAKHRLKAKKALNADDYRAWDEFQSDLADYHRASGKPAPAVLRTLDPLVFKAQYRQNGRIDIHEVAHALHEREDRATETRNWLLER